MMAEAVDVDDWPGDVEDDEPAGAAGRVGAEVTPASTRMNGSLRGPIFVVTA
jgi:hypothetical protein